MEFIIAVLVLWLLSKMFSKPARCDICGTPFKRVYHNWEIDGKKKKLCPHCNSRLERDVSKRRYNNYFK